MSFLCIIDERGVEVTEITFQAVGGWGKGGVTGGRGEDLRGHHTTALRNRGPYNNLPC